MYVTIRGVRRGAPFVGHVVLSARADGPSQLVVRDLKTGKSHVVAYGVKAHDVALSRNPEFDTTARFAYTPLSEHAAGFTYGLDARTHMIDAEGGSGWAQAGQLRHRARDRAGPHRSADLGRLPEEAFTEGEPHAPSHGEPATEVRAGAAPAAHGTGSRSREEEEVVTPPGYWPEGAQVAAYRAVGDRSVAFELPAGAQWLHSAECPT